MILSGNTLDVLRTLPGNSVQMCVTSPPYWGLRKYDIPDVTFTDGWVGQLGQEPTPAQYIAHLVEIFAQVRRVLRFDGTCFVNIGDCYANDGKWGGETGGKQAYLPDEDRKRVGREKRTTGLKPKDLVGIPWMFAFALREDGWWLRSEIIWAKGLSYCAGYAGSVMPESVVDRPTRSHEQIFLLTKSSRYFWDVEAVKERGVYPAGTLAAKGSGTRQGNRRGSSKKHKMAQREDGNHPWDGYAEYDGKRNMRTVWAIGVQGFKDAHFATFPPDLVDPCIQAGTSEKGACRSCGAPWERVTEYEPLPDEIKAQFEAARAQTAVDHGREDGFTTRRPNYERKKLAETWQPTCECPEKKIDPCVVLDPFAGSGSTGVACVRRQRSFVGIDLGYNDMAIKRIGRVAPLFE